MYRGLYKCCVHPDLLCIPTEKLYPRQDLILARIDIPGSLFLIGNILSDDNYARRVYYRIYNHCVPSLSHEKLFLDGKDSAKS